MSQSNNYIKVYTWAELQDADGASSGRKIVQDIRPFDDRDAEACKSAFNWATRKAETLRGYRPAMATWRPAFRTVPVVGEPRWRN